MRLNKIPALAGIFAASLALAAPVETDLSLAVPGGHLAGSLLTPQSQTPIPLALIIAGSGPTDRDGNSLQLPGKNNSLKLLAEGLAKEGIASLRYDKRTIGASQMPSVKEEDLRFEDFSDDAAAWIRLLRQDSRFSRIVIIGHSEGSLIGMRAAQQGHISGFVSLAGPAQRASEALRIQLAPRLNREQAEVSEGILRKLEHGQINPDVPADFMILYRPSVQPYLISWFRYAPSEEIAKLDLPILVINGTQDIQIAPANADALATANPRARKQIIEGMNHVLKTVGDDPQAQADSYSNPRLPVSPALISAIARFIHTEVQ